MKMQDKKKNYVSHYDSPLGPVFMAADEIGLTGIWFEGQKYFASTLGEDWEEKNAPVLEETKRWLETYFQGKNPDFLPPLHLIGTEFQMEVWHILCGIPYGETMTYGEIGKMLAKRRGIATMSAQAVGGAVGHNPISILVPCHRVLGAGGNLTGYAGGLEKKISLLQLEGVEMDKLSLPKKKVKNEL